MLSRQKSAVMRKDQKKFIKTLRKDAMINFLKQKGKENHLILQLINLDTTRKDLTSSFIRLQP